MIKNKTIQFSTLFVTWAIIFAHSIIPHNHHHESVEECKSHSCSSLSGIATFYSSHDHNNEDSNHCHFNINTTLTKFVDSPNIFFYSTSIIIPVYTKIQTIHFTNQNLLLKHFYFDSFTRRGPPSFS